MAASRTWAVWLWAVMAACGATDPPHFPCLDPGPDIGNRQAPAAGGYWTIDDEYAAIARSPAGLGVSSWADQEGPAPKTSTTSTCYSRVNGRRHCGANSAPPGVTALVAPASHPIHLQRAARRAGSLDAAWRAAGYADGPDPDS